MALDFPLGFFGSGSPEFDTKPAQHNFYDTDRLFLDTSSEFFSGRGAGSGEREAGTGLVSGQSPADSQGFYGGFDTLLSGVDRASQKLFGVAGRTFDAIDRFQATFTDDDASGGRFTPSGGGAPAGGIFDGPLVPIAVGGGILAALWFAFK